MKGNVDWEDPLGICSQKQDHPQKRSTLNKDQIALNELYHNPDLLFRLIGEPNKTNVIIKKKRVKGLIDSAAQISSILDTFAKRLSLRVQKL